MDSLHKWDENEEDDVDALKAEPTEHVLTPKQNVSIQNTLNEEEKAGPLVDSKLNNAEQLFDKIHNSDVFFPYDLHGDLPKFFEEKAERSLGETQERREKALIEMTKLVKDKGLDVSNDLMLCFLRMKKFDVNLALEKMEYLLNYLESHHRSVSNCVDAVTDYINSDIYHICPLRDDEGRFVLMGKALRFNPAEMKKVLYAAARIILRMMDEPANQIAGVVLILDGEGLSWQWLKTLSISNLLMGYQVFFKCLPLRYQQVHIINDNRPTHLLLKVARTLLSSKIKNRIHVHGKDLGSLHKFVPNSLLPAEYGGTGHNWRTTYTLEDIVQAKTYSPN